MKLLLRGPDGSWLWLLVLWKIAVGTSLITYWCVGALSHLAVDGRWVSDCSGWQMDGRLQLIGHILHLLLLIRPAAVEAVITCSECPDDSLLWVAV